MGWWETTREGVSFTIGDEDYVWGDSPADIFGDAVMDVRNVFKERMGREPRIGELRAGLEFTLRGLKDDDTADELD